ncbi:hypothetical protein ACNF40_00385 [Cuniculiplasma sp. SKW4]|uniref:hypothetical protein n=1 Tax=Cuniculiplasma sp. SKW4 TaxID=3400171 RepID=UPI003FD308C8
MKPENAKIMIEKITDISNRSYEFRKKKHTLDNIMFENVRELGRYISEKTKSLKFKILEIVI